MELKRIRAKKSSVRETDDEFRIDNLCIPKSFVIKTNEQNLFSTNRKNIRWVNFYLDPDFFKHTPVIIQLRLLKDAKKVFIYGRKSYGIIWDNVVSIVYDKTSFSCFFCNDKLIPGADGNKTKDHLIPVVIIHAYGLHYIDDNIVPCCKDCNREKASLHPYTFREKVKIKLKNSKLKKWRAVLEVLDRILIDKKDPFR